MAKSRIDVLVQQAVVFRQGQLRDERKKALDDASTWTLSPEERRLVKRFDKLTADAGAVLKTLLTLRPDLRAHYTARPLQKLLYLKSTRRDEIEQAYSNRLRECSRIAYQCTLDLAGVKFKDAADRLRQLNADLERV